MGLLSLTFAASFDDPYIPFDCHQATGRVYGSATGNIISDKNILSGLDINNHKMDDLPIVMVRGVVKTQRRNTIVAINQVAQIPQGKTILPTIQLGSFGINVDDCSLRMKIGQSNKS